MRDLLSCSNHAACLLVVLSTASCISHVRQPYEESRPASPTYSSGKLTQEASSPAVHAAPPGPFITTRSAVDMTLTPDTRRTPRHYTAQRFGFSATGANGQPGNVVSGRLFSGRTGGSRPVVIVLPVWGISEYPSKKFARDLMKRARGRIDVMLVDGTGYLIDWDALAGSTTVAEFKSLAGDTGARIQDMVIDVRRMVDWLTVQPQVDSARIGVIGFSLSAVVASLTLQHETRLTAGVVVMGGSNPAEIFTVCDGRPGEVRTAAMRRFGFSPEAYFQIFKQGLAGGDSRDYGGRIADPSRLLFVEATHDDCMTPESRDALWESLGRPERISFKFRHRPAFYAMTPLGFNVLGRYATGFFERQWLESE